MNDRTVRNDPNDPNDPNDLPAERESHGAAPEVELADAEVELVVRFRVLF